MKVERPTHHNCKNTQVSGHGYCNRYLHRISKAEDSTYSDSNLRRDDDSSSHIVFACKSCLNRKRCSGLWIRSEKENSTYSSALNETLDVNGMDERTNNTQTRNSKWELLQIHNTIYDVPQCTIKI